jgi:hypothetical protein
MFELLVLTSAILLLIGLMMAVNWLESQELRRYRQSLANQTDREVLHEQDADEAKAS